MYKKIALKYGVEYIAPTSAKLYNDLSGENFNTALVALFPYYEGEKEKSNLSKYAKSLDYHKVCTDIMTKICDEAGFFSYKVFCDTGYHIDRELAYDANLGFYGKNSMLINEKYGSFFFIAYALLNEKLDFENEKSDIKTCLNCQKCVKMCPGGAILSNGKINAEKCLSSITQKKGELTKDEETLIKANGYVFGCDICQNVCPHNENIPETKIDAFLQNRIENLNLSDVENLSNREFKEKYSDYAFSWRGKNVLIRNLKIIEE
jgi:epoxyqueuosine reductase QueG